MPPSSEIARIVATATIQPREIGMSHFHPRAMNWSYRSRGSVPRSQMKKKMKANSLPKNHSTGQ